MKEVFAPATFVPGVMSGIVPPDPSTSSSSSSSSSSLLSAEDVRAIASLPRRAESDTFGSLSIPPGKLWGAQTQRSVLNFPIGNVESRMPTEVVYAMCLVKKACASYGMTNGTLTEDISYAIGRAADEVMNGCHDDQFPLVIYQTGSGTQTNMNVNEVLSNRAIMVWCTPMWDKNY